MDEELNQFLNEIKKEEQTPAFQKKGERTSAKVEYINAMGTIHCVELFSRSD